ncbi:MAG: tetratricopeptide repeat protein [Burkholderiaceae bacterium]
MFDDNGQSLTGATPQAVIEYERACDELLCYTGDPVASVGRALDHSADFTMAHYLKAWLHLVGSENSGLVVANTVLGATATLSHNPREALHRQALRALVNGQIDAARQQLEEILLEHPRDLLALQVAHLFDFYCGDSRSLRDRPARVAHAWSLQDRRFHALLGMQAFGLEECNLYSQAEQAGRQALALNPRDCWAHHAVTHVYEMQGRQAQGIAWMTERQPLWADDSFFAIHHWWHLALFHLDLDQVDPVLALYDQRLRGSCSGVVLDLVDAAALLWRLKLRGEELRPRWLELADAWAAFADDDNYAFNSFHAMLAFAGAERWEQAQLVLDSLNRQLARQGSNHVMACEVGRPASLGLLHFAHEDYDAAVDQLLPIRHSAHHFGGSHAQRDVIELTLIEAAQRAGRWPLARALASERVAHKPSSPLAQRYLRAALAAG